MTSVYSSIVAKQITDYISEARASDPTVSAQDLLDSLMSHTGWASRRSATTSDPTTRCGARVWSGFNEMLGKQQAGHGAQCGKSKTNGKFCKNHAKQAAITCEPCSYWTATDDLPVKVKVGDKKGLFWGEWASEFPFMAADGKGVAIVWQRDNVKTAIALKMTEGVGYHPNTKEFKSGKTAPPRLAGTKKAKKAKTVPRKTTKRRAKKAIHRWMKDGNRTKISAAIKGLAKVTGKYPTATFHLLVAENMDVAAATKKFETYGGAGWKSFCGENDFAVEKHGVNELGDFEGTLTQGMILGLTSKMCHILWKQLSDSDKQSYVDAEAQEVIEIASMVSAEIVETPKEIVETPKEIDATPEEIIETPKEIDATPEEIVETPKEIESTLMSSEELSDEDEEAIVEEVTVIETKKVDEKKAKKSKKPKKVVVVAPEPESDDESDEELECTEFKMESGDTVYIDEEYMAYSLDGEELGYVNPTTRKFV